MSGEPAIKRLELAVRGHNFAEGLGRPKQRVASAASARRHQQQAGALQNVTVSQVRLTGRLTDFSNLVGIPTVARARCINRPSARRRGRATCGTHARETGGSSLLEPEHERCSVPFDKREDDVLHAFSVLPRRVHLPRVVRAERGCIFGIWQHLVARPTYELLRWWPVQRAGDPTSCARCDQKPIVRSRSLEHDLYGTLAERARAQSPMPRSKPPERTE